MLFAIHHTPRSGGANPDLGAEGREDAHNLRNAMATILTRELAVAAADKKHKSVERDVGLVIMGTGRRFISTGQRIKTHFPNARVMYDPFIGSAESISDLPGSEPRVILAHELELSPSEYRAPSSSPALCRATWEVLREYEKMTSEHVIIVCGRDFCNRLDKNVETKSGNIYVANTKTKILTLIFWKQ